MMPEFRTFGIQKQIICWLMIAFLTISKPQELHLDDEYENVEPPPHDESTLKSNRQHILGDASVTIIHPPQGHKFLEDDLHLEFDVKGIPLNSEYSVMVYFGDANPVPVHLTHQRTGVYVHELNHGSYSVNVMVLDGDREPVPGVQATVSFERILEEGKAAPVYSTKKDALAFEMSIRVSTWQQPQRLIESLQDLSAPAEDSTASLTQAADASSRAAITRIDAPLSPGDKEFALMSELLFSPAKRNWEQAVTVANLAAANGNSNAEFLALVLEGIDDRLGLVGDEESEMERLTACAKKKNTLCQLALAYRLAHSVGVDGKCNEATVTYRLAADSALTFVQDNTGVAPLHAVRLLELTAVVQEESKKAVEHMRVAQAERGDADAATAVAVDRFFGTGYTGSGSSKEDKQAAAELFSQAAEKENPLSLNNMGVMLLNGVGVPKNETLAFSYFNRSAALGNLWGMCSLATCYLYGHGVAPDRRRAIELWEKAAAQGSAQAHYQLGIIYRLGQGPCPPYCRNFEKAYRHFDSAAARGNVDALLLLGLMLKAGEFVKPNCTRAAMALKQCAERGPWSSLLQQAFIAWSDKDAHGAYIRYRIAAELGYRTAQVNIGYMYEMGIEGVVPQDFSRAAYFYELAAAQGDIVARRALGDIYFYGKGVDVDFAQAYRHYSMSPNDAQSVFNLASMLERGQGVARDVDMAKEMYSLATELGHGGGRRLAFEASEGEFSELPPQVAMVRLEWGLAACAMIERRKGTLLGDVLDYAIECLADIGIPLCGVFSGDRGQGTSDWTVGGLGIEMWITGLVGIATVCTAVMGPCFSTAFARRRQRR